MARLACVQHGAGHLPETACHAPLSLPKVTLRSSSRGATQMLEKKTCSRHDATAYDSVRNALGFSK